MPHFPGNFKYELVVGTLKIPLKNKNNSDFSKITTKFHWQHIVRATKNDFSHMIFLVKEQAIYAIFKGFKGFLMSFLR